MRIGHFLEGILVVLRVLEERKGEKIEDLLLQSYTPTGLSFLSSMFNLKMFILYLIMN